MKKSNIIILPIITFNLLFLPLSCKKHQPKSSRLPEDTFVTIDSNISGSYINASNISSFPISGSCSDNGQKVIISGGANGQTTCEGGRWSLNLNFSAARNLDKTNIMATTQDASGNKASTSTYLNVNISTPAAPNSISLVTASLSNDTTPTLTIGVNANEKESGGSIVLYTKGSSSNCQDNRGEKALGSDNDLQMDSSAISTDGDYYFYAKQKDIAGNESSCSSANVKYTYDGTPPNKATSLVWTEGSYSNNTTVNITWIKSTSSDLSNQKIQYYEDSSCQTTSGSAVNLSSKTTESGAFTGGHGITYTFKIISIDNAGNENYSECSSPITIDTSNPTVTITYPDADTFMNATTSSAFSVSGACSEAGRNVSITGNATATATCSSSGTWSSNLDFSGTTGNEITVTINVAQTDAAGNTSSTVSRNFIVDTVAPAVPTSISLQTTSPNIEKNPIFQVGGLEDKVTVKIYMKDGTNCATEMGSISYSGTAPGQTNVTISSSIPDYNSHDYYVKQIDMAGNESDCSTVNTAYDLDEQTTISSVTSATSNGTYGFGAAVNITLTFSAAVTVATVSPTLSLSSGGSATCALGGPSVTVSCTYTVGSSESSSDLNYTSTSSLSLNGGTIKDANNYDASTTLPSTSGSSSLAANQNLIIDTTGPTVSDVVTSTATGTYGESDVITIQVKFSDNISIAGTPKLNLGSDIGQISCTSSSTQYLICPYTVSTSQVSSQLDYNSTSALTLNGGTITDSLDGGANNATLTLPSTGSSSLYNTKIVIDSSAPTISQVTSPNDNGTYVKNQEISIYVIYDEGVTVSTSGGTPSLELNIEPRTATYDSVLSGSGDKTLIFKYTVQDDDYSAENLNYPATATLSLNGGTIKDSRMNNANSGLPTYNGSNSLGSQKAILVDARAPTISSISGTDGTYKNGSILFISVLFSEAVTVTGTPKLELDSNGTASYYSGSGTNTLIFKYNVSTGESSSDLNCSSVSLNGGTIKDSIGNEATLSPETLMSSNNAIVIDASSPSITSVSVSGASACTDNCNAGDVITINITFNESLATISGSPYITLNTGVSGGYNVTCTGTAPTSTLTCTYTVLSTDNADPLEYAITHSGNTSYLTGGTLRDSAGNDYNGLLPTAGGGSSLSQSNCTVDNTSSSISSVSASPASGYYKSGSSINIVLTFDGAVTVDTTNGTPTLSLTDSLTATYSSVSGSEVTFLYTIGASDNTASTLALSSTSALNLNSGTICDSSGNCSTSYTLPSVYLGAIYIDNTTPSISSLAVTSTSSDSDQTYTDGETISFTVTFSETVEVTGTPRLLLNISKEASYSSGSSSNALVFNYTVSSDNSDDLSFQGSTALSSYLYGGTIKDLAGTDANLSLSSISALSGIKISTSSPKVQNGSGIVISTGSSGNLTYFAGDELYIQIPFDKTVNVTGSPKLIMATKGYTNALAPYYSGSGTSTLTFKYIVAPGDTSSDLNYTSSTPAMDLENASIKDTAGNDLDLSTFNGTTYLSDNQDIVISNSVHISANLDHTCYNYFGMIQCFGSDAGGQLGDSALTQTKSGLPVNVLDTAGTGSLGATSNVTSITVGNYHSCASVDGAAQCWGKNSNGQLGDDRISGNESTKPVSVSSLTSNVTDISAGDSFTCAVHSGAAKCWGINDEYNLGDGSNTQRNTAVQVSGLTSDISQISVGTTHACALKLESDGVGGTVYCWGDNDNNQVSSGSTDPIGTPVAVWTPVAYGTPGTYEALKVATGQDYSCALLWGGGVKCWGKLNGTTHTLDSEISGLSSGVRQISAGTNHACAIFDDSSSGNVGEIKCWGDNSKYQLGNNSTIDSSTPTNVLSKASTNLTGATNISAGSYYTCAFVGSSVKCWGTNASYQLGPQIRSAETEAFPRNIYGYLLPQSGDYHTCVLPPWGGAKCWGDNQYGALGSPDYYGESVSSPKSVYKEFAGQTVVLNGGLMVAGGTEFTSSLYRGGVRSWGKNDVYGRLGNGNNLTKEKAVSVSGLENMDGITSIATGGKHACAIQNYSTANKGIVLCWGDDEYGQLGSDQVSTETLTPLSTTTKNWAYNVSQIVAGYEHTCALEGDDVFCWGRNNYGQLGDTTTTDRDEPTDISLSSIKQLTSGYYHTCALTNEDPSTTNTVKCWGLNDNGQLGNLSLNNNSSPQYVKTTTTGTNLTSVESISAGAYHTCALKTDGTVYCWGDNYYDQLGISDYSGIDTPFAGTPTQNISDAIGLSTGFNFSCAAIKNSSTNALGMKCWGNNDNGTLGNGTTTSSNDPVDVSDL